MERDGRHQPTDRLVGQRQRHVLGDCPVPVPEKVKEQAQVIFLVEASLRYEGLQLSSAFGRVGPSGMKNGIDLGAKDL